MRIMHIAPNSPYNDYWGYQENLLPKYQKKLGHDVVVIVPTLTHSEGHIVPCKPGEYILDDGVHIIKKNYKKQVIKSFTSLFAHLEVLREIESFEPDLIFYHGLLSTTIFDAIKYKKRHKNLRIVQDNHLDFNIGNGTKTIKEKIIRLYFRILNRRSIKYVDRVYGVTPWRKTYAEEYFGIPTTKTDVLIMGADDEKINFSQKQFIRESIRNTYGIRNDDFLVVSGGKIDENKKIIELIKACRSLKRCKLMLFGNTTKEIKAEFDSLVDGDTVISIGWVSADSVYDYFFAADLVCFPGQHSVLWEQACAAKAPCAFARWDGMNHVDFGGNCVFMDDVSVKGITRTISSLLFTDLYYQIKRIAESPMSDRFLYSSIAKESLKVLDDEIAE